MKSSESPTPLSLPATNSLELSYPIIVHSHLGWDWVWQRPQQFLSRLSQRHPVLFVEGPVPAENLSAPDLTLREVRDYPNVVVVQMRMPAARWSDGSWVDKERRRLLLSVLGGPLARRFRKPVQWFYDPMAVTAFAGHMQEVAIVYDCMDELSLFRGAPPELVRRERELLAIADVVFAGGPKMWEAKRQINHNCFCYGCGVDVAHFGQARTGRLSRPADIAHLESPVFGYIGVVDERLDYSLLQALAQSTSGHVVMVGPWTKIDPAQLPELSNLHWLGGRDYSTLPAYASAFDVCLMPFALNEATRFINPTKALEYMATGRPIISTAIDDVVAQFPDIVAIARNHEQFIKLAMTAAVSPDPHKIERGLRRAEGQSWDAIVDRLEEHVADVLRQGRLETDAA